MFISELCDGLYYVAKKSNKGYRKYLWFIVTQQLDEAPINVEEVPKRIRKAAHQLFDRGWKQRQL